MGTLTIHFEGICTQIKLPERTSDGALHRTVLVHAENGSIIDGISVPPHVAFLKVDDDATITGASPNIIQNTLPCLLQQPDGNWQLYGARLRVKNAADTGVTYTSSSFEIPSLTTLTPDFGALSKKVVYETDAACHFDFSSGTFLGTQGAGGSYFTSVVVNTNDIAGNTDVTLEVVDLLDEKQVGTITFKSGSTIVVTNTGGALGDSPDDFLLHYLTAEKVPADARLASGVVAAMPVPVGGSTRPEISLGDTALGPGCSNSQFP